MSKITYYGHSCFLIQTGSTSVLFDPFITGNPLAKDINIEEIQCDFIFLTHGHQDHVLDVEAIASNNTTCQVVSNYEVANFFAAKGLKTIGMNHGGTWRNDDVSIKYVTAVHTSSLPDGSYGGQPGGFVLTSGKGQRIYVAGDTCLTMDMKLIPMLLGPIDLAILPIGGHFTMDAEEAVYAAQFVQTQVVIGCHYNTFPPMEIDRAEVEEIFTGKGLQLHLLDIGATHEV